MTEKKLGRPRAAEPSTSATTWLKNSQYDQLVREAHQRETSVSAVVRDLIGKAMRAPAKAP